MIYVDAFTTTAGRGNRAGVVLDARGLSAAEMQRLAAHATASECAFGVPSTDPSSYDLEVRYFSPTREVPLCGHATIAFFHAHAASLGLRDDAFRVKTGAGILNVALENGLVVLTQAPPRVLATLSDAEAASLLAALGLSPAELEPGLPLEAITTGHAKVLVPVRSFATLARLAPDRSRLLALSPLGGASGFFVFTLDRRRADVLHHGRMFAPATGVDEDPVTGNANGPAGFYLHRHGRLAAPRDGEFRYTAVQGPGELEVRLHLTAGHVTRVQVAGHAVVV